MEDVAWSCIGIHCYVSPPGMRKPPILLPLLLLPPLPPLPPLPLLPLSNHKKSRLVKWQIWKRSKVKIVSWFSRMEKNCLHPIMPRAKRTCVRACLLSCLIACLRACNLIVIFFCSLSSSWSCYFSLLCRLSCFYSLSLHFHFFYFSLWTILMRYLIGSLSQLPQFWSRTKTKSVSIGLLVC